MFYISTITRFSFHEQMMEYYFEKITAGLNLEMVEHKKDVSNKMLHLLFLAF